MVALTSCLFVCIPGVVLLFMSLVFQVIWINLIVVVLYIINASCIIWMMGWDGSPLAVRILILFCLLPFLTRILDGFTRCGDFTGLWNMLVSAPFALPF